LYKNPKSNDNIDTNETSDKESSRPPNAASTVVATEPHPTLKIKAEASHTSSQATNSSISDDIRAIREFSDSDLTDIDDSATPDVRGATVGNQCAKADVSVINSNKTLLAGTRVNRRSTRRTCPTRRLTLLRDEQVNSNCRDHPPRRRHSLPTSATLTNISTSSTLATMQVRPTKWKEAKTGQKGHDMDSVERRMSGRLQTNGKKRISILEYFDEGSDDGCGSAVVVPPRSHNGAPQDVGSKSQMEANGDSDPDSWKAGWSKVDDWAKEPPENQPFVKDVPAITMRRHQPVRTSRRPKRMLYSTSTGPRVECPKGCGKTFGRLLDARRHANQTIGCGGGKRFVCVTCGIPFCRRDALRRHQNKQKHGSSPGPERC